MNDTSSSAIDSRVDALETITVEAWRLTKVMERLVAEVDAGQQQRYRNKLRWFIKQLSGALESTGLKLVNLEGQPYDPGDAATALNLGEFSPGDRLVVDQVLEPTLLGPNGVLRAGTVILKREQ